MDRWRRGRTQSKAGWIQHVDVAWVEAGGGEILNRAEAERATQAGGSSAHDRQVADDEGSAALVQLVFGKDLDDEFGADAGGVAHNDRDDRIHAHAHGRSFALNNDRIVTESQAAYLARRVGVHQ